MHIPTAPHSYFRVRNIESQLQAFLENPSHAPDFKYGKKYDASFVKEAFAFNENTKGSAEDIFRKKKLELILKSIELQTIDSKLSDQLVMDFRKINKSIYGAPELVYANAILGRAKTKVTSKNIAYWDYIGARLNIESEVLNIWPNDTIFSTIRKFARSYMNHMGPPAADKTFVQVLQDTLDSSGLLQNGWQIVTVRGGSPVRINHDKNTIRMGRRFIVRSRKSIRRLAAHEVYGHAVRGGKLCLEDSEGFAVLLEQTLDRNFKPRRTCRYLAASIAWGVYGKPLDFIQTFEILWRYIVIIKNLSELESKTIAFRECARTFRGGRPDIAGTIFLRDSVYFKANIKVWQRLQDINVGYNEFMEIAKGKELLV